MNRPTPWSREIPVGDWIRRARERPTAVALGLGVALRLLEYLYDRSPWLDEGSLIGCIREVGRVGLFGPLGATQLAPPGFLAAEWLATRLLGDVPLAYRLVPFGAGVAALFLFRALAQRILTPRGTTLAVLLFALTDDLIYYSAEIKQYSCDLALSLLVLVQAEGVNDREVTGVRRPGLGRLGLLGAVLAWCSHPLALTLAAVGSLNLGRAASRRDWSGCVAWAGVGLVWLASIVAVRAVGMRQLGYRPDIWAFWEFAFPTWPIASSWDLLWPVRRLLFLFASPLNFDWPLGPRWSIGPAVALTWWGVARLGRAQSVGLGLLLLPGSFALVAAYLRIYPFHGRLLLFWVPLLLIPLAEGLDAVASRGLRWFLIAWVVGGLGWTAAGHLTGPRERLDPNPFGDRRPGSLDPTWYPLARPAESWRRPPG